MDVGPPLCTLLQLEMAMDGARSGQFVVIGRHRIKQEATSSQVGKFATSAAAADYILL